MLFHTKPQAIILDCDGVIFDINKEKTSAFAAAVKDYPQDKVAIFVKKHQETGGVSRYEKFAWFFRELCLVNNPNEAVKKALRNYAQIVENAYREMIPVQQAMNFVLGMKNKIKIFVASGSDQKELRAVFDFHGITPHFIEILGSPTTKTENVKSILRNHGLSAEDVLFIGDGGGDYQTTLELEVPFVYLAEMSEWQPSSVEIQRHPKMWIKPTWLELLEDFNVQ